MGATRTKRPRSRQFGTVRKLPSGRYQALYWKDGTRHSTIFLTQRDATRHLSTVEADVLRGNWANPQTGRVRFGEYAERWLERRDLRESTRAKYRYLLDKHLLPTFSDVPLAKLDPGQIAEWHAPLRRHHPSTAAGAYRLLATICNSAVHEKKLPRSPCEIKGASTEDSPKRPTATVAELQAAIDAAPERFRCALLLAAWGQLRRGEVLGLQRRDINLKTGSVTVQRGWTLTSAGKTVLDEPKTKAGKRTVHLPAQAREAVEAHLDRFVGPEPTAWLFARGAMPVYPRTFLRAWVKARQAVGRPDLHLHDLRHSGLTWVAQSGATVAELMRRARHASPVAAMRYQHAADERDRALADALGRMM